MSEAASQPSATPPASGSPAQPAPAQDPGATTTPPATPAAPATGSEVDLTTLSGDQLAKVLENPALFELPRIKQLREQAAEAKTLKEAQDKAAEDKLKEDKKFQELSEKQGETITELKSQLKTRDINQALTTKLVKENVVDIDGALKLIDRSNLDVDDNGQVKGVDEAIKSLKTDKAYLFTSGSGNQTGSQPSVGTPSNPAAPATPGTGQYKFKESQLTPEFYKANKEAVDEAGRLGLIEPDGPPRQ